MRIRKIFTFPRWLRLALTAFVAVVVCLLLVLTIGVNTSFVQGKIISLATEALSKELQTEVQIKDIDVNIFGQRVSVYGVRMQDQNRRELLQVKEIWTNFRLLPLLKGRVELKEVKISGVDMLLSKPEDGPANYQFLLDRNKKKGKKKKAKPSIFSLDLRHAMVSGVNVRYNDQDYLLEKAVYSFWREQRHVDIKGLHFKTDNHKLRKNTYKPHRGYFDVGHLDLVADLGLDISRIGKDTLAGVISKCNVTDTVTGFYFNSLRAGIVYSNKQIHLSDVSFNQVSTRFDIPEADIILPDKKLDRKLHYTADSIYVRTFLKDIARPFAPVLRNFSIPLNVRVGLDGTPQSIVLRGIHVNTDDNLLMINSTGVLRNLKGRDFKLHFEVHDMVARPGIKDKIILQFPGKKHMLYQLYALGVVKYHGSFDILWRKQQFRGLLNTEKGNIDFEFQLDGNTKYLSGRASTDSLELGDLFKLKKIHDVAASATFNVDISKPRTAEIRKKKGGKLPIGEVTADISRIGYKNIHLKNIFADIESDGAVAEGTVTMKGSLTDLMLEFYFTDTEAMHQMKVKPRLKFRSLVN
jgi:hypothetical protein